MAKLEILHYPDKRLRTVAEPVDVVDDSIRTLVDDMLETMYAAPGIGLAATQVDVHKRVIVMDLSENKDEPMCFINPEIIKSEGIEQAEEGCLSVPDVFEEVYGAILSAASPGARLVYWNMMAPRRVPEKYVANVNTLTDVETRLKAEDKAFFYSDFVVEEVCV